MHAGRDPKHARQAGHLRDRECPRGFLLPNVSSPKEGRQEEACNQPQTTQPVGENRAFQNGKHSHAQRPAKHRRLDGQDRLEGSVLHGPYGQGGQRIPPLSVERKAYQFNCLPFGLSSAPWVFTKTTRPVVAALRELGLRLIIYIDDILVVAETESLLKDHIMGVVFLLENLGFVINYPKSQLNPSQEIEFLGFTINSATMGLRLPGEKIKKMRSETDKVLQTQSVTALMLSRLIGKMNAATQAILMAPLYYRNLQACLREALQKAQDYSSTATLTEEAREEL